MSEPAKKIRIFLLDDHPVVRAGVRRLIDDEPDLHVVGEASGGVEMMKMLPTLECDIVILDLSLPGRAGFEVLDELQKTRPDIRVLILSVYPEAQYAARLLRAGASGYLSKVRGSGEILTALRTIAKGERYLTKMAAQSLENFEQSGGKLPHEALSEREAEVFWRLAQGAAPGDIGEDLGLSPSTVGTYVARIKDKIGAATLGEIVAYAHRNRLVE